MDDIGVDRHRGRPGGAAAARAAVARQHSVASLVSHVGVVLGHTTDPVGEARELVAALYDAPRFWPIANADAPVDPGMWARAVGAARLRALGAPLAYAVGRANFRHLTLSVDERVLIPRPETEQLVDLVLDEQAAVGPVGGVVIDVGTGSGAIALALATEGRFDRVIGTDISLGALEVARANALDHRRALRARVEFVAGSLLAGVATGAHVIVSNPPYIAFDEVDALPLSVRNWEPTVALLSAAEGLATTKQLVREAATNLEPGGLLALEVDARRASFVAEFVSGEPRFAAVQVRRDLTGRERFVLARRKEWE